MITEQIAHPKVASQNEWLAARKALLADEKEMTRHYDRVNAKRRRLPMVRVEKNYLFDTPDGKHSLADLFNGKHQLIVYHFMFDPNWDSGCSGCTDYVNSLGDLSMLRRHDTEFVLVSRAPLGKLEAYKREKGWTEPWVSSYGTDFNYDYHVSLDQSIAPVEYNFKTKAELEAKSKSEYDKCEMPGISVFFKMGDEIFHTYSTYARGGESVTDWYRLLDLTPYGRQEDFEDSPDGWPQRPTYEKFD